MRQRGGNRRRRRRLRGDPGRAVVPGEGDRPSAVVPRVELAVKEQPATPISTTLAQTRKGAQRETDFPGFPRAPDPRENLHAEHSDQEAVLTEIKALTTPRASISHGHGFQTASPMCRSANRTS